MPWIVDKSRLNGFLFVLQVARFILLEERHPFIRGSGARTLKMNDFCALLVDALILFCNISGGYLVVISVIP